MPLCGQDNKGGAGSPVEQKLARGPAAGIGHLKAGGDQLAVRAASAAADSLDWPALASSPV